MDLQPVEFGKLTEDFTSFMKDREEESREIFAPEFIPLFFYKTYRVELFRVGGNLYRQNARTYCFIEFCTENILSELYFSPLMVRLSLILKTSDCFLELVIAYINSSVYYSVGRISFSFEGEVIAHSTEIDFLEKLTPIVPLLNTLLRTNVDVLSPHFTPKSLNQFFRHYMVNISKDISRDFPDLQRYEGILYRRETDRTIAGIAMVDIPIETV